MDAIHPALENSDLRRDLKDWDLLKAGGCM
jgi:hypothetical protein